MTLTEIRQKAKDEGDNPAVTTFANITGEPGDDWIGSGIAETVTADLKNLKGMVN